LTLEFFDKLAATDQDGGCSLKKRQVAREKRPIDSRAPRPQRRKKKEGTAESLKTGGWDSNKGRTYVSRGGEYIRARNGTYKKLENTARGKGFCRGRGGAESKGRAINTMSTKSPVEAPNH